MTTDEILWLSNLLFVVISGSAVLVWSILARWRRRPDGRAALEQRLEAAGFEPQGSIFARRLGPIPLHAGISGSGSGLVLTVQGPRLPGHCPHFEEGKAHGSPSADPTRIQTGDDRFDEAVRAAHPDPQQGLAWLCDEVRDAAHDAVALPAHITDGRWRYRQDATEATDLEGIVHAIMRASLALAEPPDSADAGLEHLATHDPVPKVRRRAIAALHRRGALRAPFAEALVHSPYADVHLALLDVGGAWVPAAWRALRRSGSRRQRAEGAATVGALAADRRVELGSDGMDALVHELMACLGDGPDGPVSPTDAAAVLERLDWPQLLGDLLAFSRDRPSPAAAALTQRLKDRHRSAARGAVSLASPTAGALAVAAHDDTQLPH